MKRLYLVLLAGATLFLFAPSQADAQVVVKEKRVSPAQLAKLRSADTPRSVLSGETLHNGDVVSIQRKDDSTVNGVFVYEDPALERIYVRPRPNAVPVAVPVDQIEEVDRIVAVSLQRDDGRVRPAHDDIVTGPRAREIVEQVIYNGTVKQIHYHAPTLSLAEKQELAELAKAANSLAASEEAVKSLEEEAIAPKVEPARPQPPTAPNAWSYFTFTRQPRINTFGPMMAPPVPYVAPAANEVNVNVSSSPAPPATSKAELQKSLQDARARARADREIYQSARSRVVLDANGAVVAVRLDQPATSARAAAR